MSPQQPKAPADSHESIRELMIELTHQVRGIREDLHGQGKVVESLLRWKTGGDSPHKGMDVRVDRLEQSSKTVSMVAWGALGTAGSVIFGWVWMMITGRHER